MSGAPSDERLGLSFVLVIVTLLTGKLLLVLASTVILGSESHGTQDYILLSDGSGSLQTIDPLNPLGKLSKSKSRYDRRSVGQ
jgi:hypothetical protein